MKANPLSGGFLSVAAGGLRLSSSIAVGSLSVKDYIHDEYRFVFFQ